MKSKIIFLSFFIIVMLLSGCTSDQTAFRELQNENEALKAKISSLEKDLSNLKKENDSLKSDIEDLRFAPDKLLKQAQTYFTEKKYDLAKNTINTLLSKHSDTGEAEQAKQLQAQIDTAVKKEQEDLQKRIASATNKMRKEIDEVQDITWYYDKTSPKYVNNNGFYLYIGTQKDMLPSLRLKLQYAGDDWLFIYEYILKADDKTFSIYATDTDKVKRDAVNGGVYEYLDIPIESYDQYHMIKTIISSQKTIVRYQGKQHIFDKTLTKQEKQALQNVLDAYKALGGDLSDLYE